MPILRTRSPRADITSGHEGATVPKMARKARRLIAPQPSVAGKRLGSACNLCPLGS